jgi:hypothetical protein
MRSGTNNSAEQSAIGVAGAGMPRQPTIPPNTALSARLAQGSPANQQFRQTERYSGARGLAPTATNNSVEQSAIVADPPKRRRTPPDYFNFNCSFEVKLGWA